MKNNLLFSFSVNKENKTIYVQREFDASLDLVWKAWTTAELLDQWWAPKPWKTETKSLDFNVGGFWLYAMVGPDGEKHWCKSDYTAIQKEKTFSSQDHFCDEEGNINTSFPQNKWQNSFAAKGDTTTVDVTLSFDAIEDLEKLIEMGFKEGFTMGLQNLDELLASLKK